MGVVVRRYIDILSIIINFSLIYKGIHVYDDYRGNYRTVIVTVITYIII